MFMRRRPLVRAAAIGGAYVAGRHVARQSMARDQAENERNARLADTRSAGPARDPAQARTLSDDEFTTAKARLLAS
jgi:hypothetical protein